MACAKHSDTFARLETDDEIKSLDLLEDKDVDTDFVQPSQQGETSYRKSTCSKCMAEADLRDMFYDRCVVYSEICTTLPIERTLSSPIVDERRCASRRSGRVDPPRAITQGNTNNIPDCAYPNEDGKRRRNLSESSYFAANTVQDANAGDEMCCDINEPDDRICPSRIRGCHGRYSVDNITNASAINCLRWRMRRNALCDPFRLLLPQHVRERLERNNERRKTSVVRRVSQFMTVNFDLERDEELI